ncbi:hypothetical protein X797_005714 [Metarhizium robertsii]|uniref:Uncharacterized protein n=1 Tax=Metarhizium robertsii TaxID=568076 RepID=A0A014PS63_9HYPO|nr:hypothetical protein X797_005714 [Metarhizium robertsii]
MCPRPKPKSSSRNLNRSRSRQLAMDAFAPERGIKKLFILFFGTGVVSVWLGPALTRIVLDPGLVRMPCLSRPLGEAARCLLMKKAE